MGGCGEAPSDYNDCILKHVKPGLDQTAVLVVTQSCRAKFPVDGSSESGSAVDRDLTALELSALSGRARDYGDQYSGTIYNGNANVMITEIEITVATTIDKVEVSRPYRTPLSIPPQSAKSFGFHLIPGDTGASYAWSITGARGRPVR